MPDPVAKVYICRPCGRPVKDKPEQTTENGILCDKCNDWFHWGCVGIKTLPAKDKRYVCGDCTKLITTKNCFACEIEFKDKEPKKFCATCDNVVHHACRNDKKECVKCSPPASLACLDCEANIMENAAVCVDCSESLHRECLKDDRCRTCHMSEVEIENQDLKVSVSRLEKLVKELLDAHEVREKESAELKKRAEEVRKIPTPRKSMIDESLLMRASQVIQSAGATSTTENSATSSSEVRSSLSSSQVTSTSDNVQKRILRRDLPELEKFDGNVLNWPSFIKSYTETTSQGGYNEFENLGRLRKAITGDAAIKVRASLRMGISGDAVVKKLEEIYGKKEVLIRALSKQMLSFKKLSDVADPKLIDFSCEVETYVQMLISLDRKQDLQNEWLLAEVEEILCAQHEREWTREKKRIQREKPDADLEDFAVFVGELASEIRIKPDVNAKQSTLKDQKFKSVNLVQSVSAVNGVNGTFNRGFQCYKCGEGHRLRVCEKFLSSKPIERYRFVKDNRICVRCLSKASHDFAKCSRRCELPECRGSHNTLLHDESRKVGNSGPNKTSQTSENSLKQQSVTSGTQGSNYAHQSEVNDRVNIVVPIRAYCADGLNYVDTYAMFDHCSDMTMIDEDFWRQLNLNFQPTDLHVMWTKNFTRTEKSNHGRMRIGDRKGELKFELKDVYTSKNINLKKVSFNSEEMKKRYPHLRGIEYHDYKNVRPTMLLGLDCASIMIQVNNRFGDINQPVASKTLFGWVAWGPDYSQSDPDESKFQSSYYVRKARRIMCHSKAVMDVEDEHEYYDELHELVKNHLVLDELKPKADKVLISEDDQRAIDIMENSIKYENGRYSMRLLWKRDDQELPDNFEYAVERMKQDEKRLEKLGLTQWKADLIREQLAAGHIRKATEKDLTTNWKRVNYCPQFATINKNKEPPKPRNVSDTAARTKGISLNDCLLKGPDNLTPLPRCLMRMRQNAIAYTADIEKMYHQLRIQSPDEQCQRFLFREGDYNKDPKDCIWIMPAMMFGPRCSPCMAQFVKNYHAKKYKDTHPKAFEVITNSTYVDDSSDSQPTVEMAYQSASECMEVYQSGGFNLTAFQSNSIALLELLPADRVKGDVKVMEEKGESECIVKILGLRWSTSSDEFVFVLKKDQNFEELSEGKVTKRRALRAVMQIFDPLGFLSAITVRGKFVIQEIWRVGTDWDDEVNEDIKVMWREFEKEIHSACNVRIPRRLSQCDPKTAKVQLVVFVDASDVAYAAVAYFRMKSEQSDEFQVSLALGKSKVAPVKYMSIPRLELNAAVLGVRIAMCVKELVDFPIHDIKFHSDSKTVLSWIKSTERKYKVFVAARISEILESTTVEQWHYVPSKENVADDSTKWKGVREFSTQSRWFVGPDYLKEEESSWPTSPISSVKEDEVSEVTSYTYIHRYGSPNKLSCLELFDIGKFSNWFSFVRSVAIVIRFAFKRFTTHKENGRIKVNELHDARLMIFRKIQNDAFGEMIGSLKYIQKLIDHGNYTEDINDLFKEAAGEFLTWSPYIDDEGTMRASTRNQYSKLPKSFRDPVILPAKHPWVDFLVQAYHEANFHRMDGTTICDLRQFCAIQHVKRTLKRVKRNCLRCKQSASRPEFPYMSQHQDLRQEFGVKPWTHVGIDMFGPFTCHFKRGTAKRYGLIFTCLTYRGVHIELVQSESMNDCMLAIRNFLAIRGVSRHFYSDNGRNFVGSRNLMTKDFIDMQNQLGEEIARAKSIEWHFIPKYSPWMGGAWERLIGSIKSCLNHTFFNQRIHEERVLETALKEIAFLMNRRPLTHVPVDPKEERPLTPNTVMIGEEEEDISMTTGVFHEADEVSPKFYRRAEHLVQKYMRRFVREYLPGIAKREKWHVKRDVKIGDIVLVSEVVKDMKGGDNQQLTKFCRKAKVIKVHPGSDGEIRVVDILVGGEKPKVMKYRAVGNLVFLDVNAESGIRQEESEYGGEFVDAPAK